MDQWIVIVQFDNVTGRRNKKEESVHREMEMNQAREGGSVLFVNLVRVLTKFEESNLFLTLHRVRVGFARIFVHNTKFCVAR